MTANSPITIRHICARLEYATTPRKSGWRNASSDPYTSPIEASARMVFRIVSTGSGKWEIAMNRKPYAAVFEITPESTADTSAGDSR